MTEAERAPYLEAEGELDGWQTLKRVVKNKKLSKHVLRFQNSHRWKSCDDMKIDMVRVFTGFLPRCTHTHTRTHAHTHAHTHIQVSRPYISPPQS